MKSSETAITLETTLSQSAKANSKTLFVIGNGPSLKEVDLHALSNYATIGMNAAYRHWKQIDWRPTYYACLDLVVGLSHKNEIENLIREGRIKKFLLRSNLIDALGEIGRSERVINFDALTATEELLRPPAVTTGSHAMLWGAALGYNEIALLGIDGRYANVIQGAIRKPGIELEIREQPAENPNYFFDGYQQTGDRYNLPNPRPNLHVDAWRTAASLISDKNILVLNAGKDSAVRCFPFIELTDYLSKGSVVRPAEEVIDPAVFLDMHGPGDTKSPSRTARLMAFLKEEWIACLAPIVFLAIAAAILSGASGMKPPVDLLAIIGAVVTAIWVAILFIRKTLTGHIKALYKRIEALEEHAKSMSAHDHKRS